MTEDMGQVCVVGLGYVGVPTAAVLAGHGMEVIGVDIDRERVETINSGASPFDEPGLDSLVAEVVASGALSARGEPAPADAFIIAVPTPIREDRGPDLSYVRSAIDNLAPAAREGQPGGCGVDMSRWNDRKSVRVACVFAPGPDVSALRGRGERYPSGVLRGAHSTRGTP